MDILEEYFKLPSNCFINSRIPKKAFTDNPEFDLKKEEKTLLKDYVENIYFQYSLKPQNINIAAYENEEFRYEEIEIIKVKLKKQSKEEKVCNLIQKYIPYPILIFLECGNYIKLNVTKKKINKVEKEKLTFEEMIYTDWINLNTLAQKQKDFLKSLDINKLSTNNLFEIYEGFINSINSFNLSKYKENFTVKPIETTLKDMNILYEVEKKEEEILFLRNTLKKESNVGTKVELNVKIKKLKKKIEDLKERLS
jgi:hypothetical protein